MVEILSEQETAVLISHLADRPLRDNCIIRLMLQCGLRVGEVVGLNIDNISRFSIVNNTIYIPVGTVKGHNPRHVDVPHVLKSLLGDYLLQRAHQLDFNTDGAPVFVSNFKQIRLWPRDVQRTLDRISTACLGRSVHPHILRHTYATVLMKHTNIRVVQQLLGHASLSSTQIYTHVNSEDCRIAVNKAFTE